MASGWKASAVTSDNERLLKILQDALQGLSDCTLVRESATNIVRAYQQSKAACDEMQKAIRAWPTDGAPTADASATSAGGDALPAVGQVDRPLRSLPEHD